VRKTLIVGDGGREAALAVRMAESSSLHALMGHANPTICSVAEASGGRWDLGDVCDGRMVARFAIDNAIDVAMVSSDDPLAAGVVDALAAAGVRAVGPTRHGAQIEWDKAFSRRLVAGVTAGANPLFAFASTGAEVDDAIARVGAECGPVVVKPVGLAGGKGVRVVGPHLADNAAAGIYAKEIVSSGRHGGAVLIEERIDAPEFTIQAMTDGCTVIFPPATFDYPYRFAGDTGPGTGGMGCVTEADGLLPFLDRRTYDAACGIVRGALDYLARDGRSFSGCLNAGFFATPDGLRVIEFNARFGDPEGINIMSLLESDWCDTMEAMATGHLSDADITLACDASAVVYLVAPTYALGGVSPVPFGFDVTAARQNGVEAIFSSAVETSTGTGNFMTVGTSRALALVARHPTLAEASAAALSATASMNGVLEWRADIGVLPGPVMPPLPSPRHRRRSLASAEQRFGHRLPSSLRG